MRGPCRSQTHGCPAWPDQPDDGGTIVHGAVCRALDMVASIHQQHILALLLIALLEGCDGSIGQLRGFVVDVSMDIVGIKDGDFRQLAFAKAGRRRGSSYGHSRSDTSGFQKAAARDKSFHEERPPFVFSGFGSDGLSPLHCTVALSLTQNAASGKSKMSNMRKIHPQKVVLFRSFLKKQRKAGPCLLPQESRTRFFRKEERPKTGLGNIRSRYIS